MVHFVRAGAAEADEDNEPDWLRSTLLLWPLCLANADALPEIVVSTFLETLGGQLPEGEERAHTYTEAMGDLGLFLFALHEEGHPHAGNAAVQILRAVVDAMPPDRPTRPLALCGLGFALIDQLQDATDPAQFEEPLALFQEAFDKAMGPNRSRAATGLALSLRAKALLSQDGQLLAQAADVFRAAVHEADEQDQPPLLAELGHTLVLWASTHVLPQPAVLQEAIAAQRAARERLPELNPVLLTQFGLGLLDAHQAGVAEASIDEAVTLLEQAVAGFPDGSQEQSEASDLLHQAVAARNQAISPERAALLHRSLPDEAEADPDSLEAVLLRLVGMVPGAADSRHMQSMRLMEAVLRYPTRASLSEVMTTALLTLQQQVAHLAPAEQAEALFRIAEEPPDEPARHVDPAELAEIADLLDRVGQQAPVDDATPELIMLQLTRLQLGLVTTDRTDPQAMAEILGKAMRRLPELMAKADVPVSQLEPMAAMGGALLSPFEALHKVEQDVRVFREQLAAEQTVEARRTLAQALFMHYRLTQEEAVFQEAVAHAKAVLDAASPPDRGIAVLWASSAVSRAHWGSVHGGGGVAQMASNMAVQSVAQNDGPGALESIEDGRALMLSNAFNTRREVDNLRRIAPDLAEEFTVLRQRIRDGQQPGIAPSPDHVAQFRELAAQWSELVERIKALPSFDRFLMPLPMGLADLLPAAADGPVVTINVNPRRCDAIILRAEDTLLVPLPSLDHEQLGRQAERFHTALSDVDSRDAVTTETLAWLWDAVAEPVLSTLDLPAGSRLWWSPTGALNFLPLHAAGRDGESALDRVVSSYTPTIRALMYSRAGALAASRSALAVAMPDTPGHAPLPATVAEAEAIASRIPGPSPLIGPEATRSAVLYGLPHVNVAHFACHAGSDPQNPSDSHLVLHDGPLDVATIARMRLDNAELAYLSACATARGSVRFADEAVHIASAFQLAGFSQVIATLWEINDRVAAAAAAKVHRELSQSLSQPGPLPAATALNSVTRQMRDTWPDNPSIWAAYIHAGT